MHVSCVWIQVLGSYVSHVGIMSVCVDTDDGYLCIVF